MFSLHSWLHHNQSQKIIIRVRFISFIEKEVYQYLRNVILNDNSVRENPHKQGNIPSSLNQPEGGKLISVLNQGDVGHPKQEWRVLSAPQDWVWFVIKSKTEIPGGTSCYANRSGLSVWKFTLGFHEAKTVYRVTIFKELTNRRWYFHVQFPVESKARFLYILYISLHPLFQLLCEPLVFPFSHVSNNYTRIKGAGAGADAEVSNCLLSVVQEPHVCVLGS